MDALTFYFLPLGPKHNFRTIDSGPALTLQSIRAYEDLKSRDAPLDQQ